jgi:5-methylcytosine-specific restriction endonuclease McrA
MKKVRQDPEAYKQLRKTILERDGWRCQNCGTRQRLDVHHIIPRARGGEDHERNLITLCRSCHDELEWIHDCSEC